MKTKGFDDSRRRTACDHGNRYGGVLLARRPFRTLHARPTEPSSAGPVNETLKTIHSLRRSTGTSPTRRAGRGHPAHHRRSGPRRQRVSLSSYSIGRCEGRRDDCQADAIPRELVSFCTVWTTRASTDSAPHLGYRFQGEDMESFVTGSDQTPFSPPRPRSSPAKSLGIDSC